MTWTDLLKDGSLTPESPAKAELDNFRSIVRLRLADADDLVASVMKFQQDVENWIRAQDPSLS